MQLIESEQITHWSYTATMLHRVVTHPALDDYDLTSLRSGGGGGSTFSPALQRRAKEALPNLGKTMGVGYGQTECAALATLNSGDELNQFPESAGRPLPTVQLEIRDPLGAVLPDGEEGEIHLRGPMVMPGLLAPAGGDRRGDRPRPLAAHRRHRAARGGSPLPRLAPPGPHHPRRREHLPGRDREPARGAPGRRRGRGRSRSTTRSSARRCERSSCPPPGRRSTRTSSRRGARRRLSYFKVPTHWDIRTEPLPRNASGKVVKQVLLDGAPLQFVEDEA